MQPGNLAFKPAEADDYFVQLFALRCLLGADCPQHVKDKVRPFVAHNLFSVTNTRG